MLGRIYNKKKSEFWVYRILDCIFLLKTNVSFDLSLYSALRLVDVSSDSNKFQELLLERTKALAAQTEALKSSSHSDGKFKQKINVQHFAIE